MLLDGQDLRLSLGVNKCKHRSDWITALAFDKSYHGFTFNDDKPGKHFDRLVKSEKKLFGSQIWNETAQVNAE